MTITYIKKTKENNPIQTFNSYKKDSIINVYSPTETEIDFLVKKFDLDEDHIEDALDENELPRIDFEKDKTYIYLRNIELNKSFPFVIILTKTDILFLSKYEVDITKQIFKLNEKIYTNHRLRILISVLDIFSQNLEKVVKQILKLVSKKKSNDEFLDSDLLSFLNYEDTLNHIISVYNYIDNVYTRMLKKIKFVNEDKEILEDLKIDLEEGLFICKNSKKTINSMREIQSIGITNKLNKSIKLLTSFTIFINIPVIFFSLYGMNILLPFQQVEYVFYYLILVIIFFVVLLYYYLKKNKIL